MQVIISPDTISRSRKAGGVWISLEQLVGEKHVYPPPHTPPEAARILMCRFTSVLCQLAYI